jgi:hypothetical protein
MIMTKASTFTSPATTTTASFGSLKRHLGNCALAAGIVTGIVAADMSGVSPYFPVVGQAQALPGHPLTPLSAAGVHRRAVRRAIRRSAILYGALPRACVRTSIDGTVVFRCGGTYYQPWRGRYVVVFID